MRDEDCLCAKAHTAVLVDAIVEVIALGLNAAN